MSKKYLLCPGEVISQNDGEIHFIGSRKLAELYEVHLSECLVRGRLTEEAGLIPLYPDPSGKYERPGDE